MRYATRASQGSHNRAFTISNGSPQSSQRCSDLHAVALNRAVCRVRGEPQRGQPGDSGEPKSGGPKLSVSGTAPPRRGAGDGGAMPASASLPLPSSVIQSLVQAGASWVATVTGEKPARSRRDRTSALISRMAGQPL